MPMLEFKGKPFVYSHHLSVPFRELVIHPKKSLPGGKQFFVGSRVGGAGSTPEYLGDWTGSAGPVANPFVARLTVPRMPGASTSALT